MIEEKLWSQKSDQEIIEDVSKIVKYYDDLILEQYRPYWIEQLKKNNRRNKRMRRHMKGQGR